MRSIATVLVGALVGIGGVQVAEPASAAAFFSPPFASADALVTEQVTVDPVPTDVAPGAVLTVAGNGFAPGVALVVRWCHAGASWCFPQETFTADGSGTFSLAVLARRAVGPGPDGDCTQVGSCRLEVGFPGSYPAVTVHTTVPVSVDPTAAVNTPTAAFEASSALAIGEYIDVAGAGWIGASTVTVEICGGDPAVCGEARALASDVRGALTGRVVAKRSPSTVSGVDCVVVATGCWFRFHDDLIGAVVDVPFSLAATDWPRVSGSDVRVVEGDRGTRVVSAELRLDRPAPHRVVVNLTRGRANLEHTDGAPWEAVIFEPGQIRRPLRFSVFGDEIFEGDEFVEVFMRSDEAIITRARVRFVVEDDDARPRAYLGDVAEAEGDRDGARCVVVELTNPSDWIVRVRFVTFGGTADPGYDYTRVPQSSTSAYLYPGETAAEMCVEVVGDRRRERDETVVIVGWAPQNATLVDAVATLTLENDD